MCGSFLQMFESQQFCRHYNHVQKACAASQGIKPITYIDHLIDVSQLQTFVIVALRPTGTQLIPSVAAVTANRQIFVYRYLGK